MVLDCLGGSKPLLGEIAFRYRVVAVSWQMAGVDKVDDASQWVESLFTIVERCKLHLLRDLGVQRDIAIFSLTLEVLLDTEDQDGWSVANGSSAQSEPSPTLSRGQGCAVVNGGA